jgi:hypothetical protein
MSVRLLVGFLASVCGTDRSSSELLCLGREREKDGMRLDGGCGCAGSSAMVNTWEAAEEGHVGEVQRLVGHDPGLLHASQHGHMGVVRQLVDHGADCPGRTEW